MLCTATANFRAYDPHYQPVMTPRRFALNFVKLSAVNSSYRNATLMPALHMQLNCRNMEHVHASYTEWLQTLNR